MIHRGLVCLLLGALAWGQAASSKPAQPQTPAPASAAAPQAKAPATAEVAPDAPVITLPGLCENATADKADCKTVITRAQFEQLLNAVAPNVPPGAKKQIASRYATMLVMQNEAHKQGVDQGPKFEELIKINRMTVMAQALQEHLQEKAGEISDKELQDYYDKNQAAYEEASVQRIFIPRGKIFDASASKEKLSEAETKKRQEDGEAAMKSEADAIAKKAATGEEFSKLQEEAYTTAGQKAKPPSTSMGKVRRTSLPPAHGVVFDLKPGAVSPLITDASGYFVYKVVDKDTLPFDKVKDEIHNSMRAQRMQDSMQSIQQSVNPTFNDAYFAAPAGPEAEPEGEQAPPQKPQPKAPTAGKK